MHLALPVVAEVGLAKRRAEVAARPEVAPEALTAAVRTTGSSALVRRRRSADAVGSNA